LAPFFWVGCSARILWHWSIAFNRGNLLLSSLIFVFILSYIGSVIHLEAILGAFAAGLILAETDKKRELEEQILPIADMLVPIFFVVVGAKTDISVLNPFVPSNQEGLIIASFLVIVAIIGKVVTGLAVFGQPGINRLAIGVGMIPRGEVGLVFAGVGSTTGILDKSLNAAHHCHGDCYHFHRASLAARRFSTKRMKNLKK